MLERLLVPLVSEADIEAVFEEFVEKGPGAVRDSEFVALREEVQHIVSCTSHAKIKDVREMFTSWHGRTPVAWWAGCAGRAFRGIGSAIISHTGAWPPHVECDEGECCR
jgi:hypothetical protein